MIIITREHRFCGMLDCWGMYQCEVMAVEMNYVSVPYGIKSIKCSPIFDPSSIKLLSVKLDLMFKPFG